MKTKSIMLMCTACPMAFAAPALAQDAVPASDSGSSTIQEIVVTAQKRSENLQKVPLAIAAFDNAALASRGVKQIAELTYVTPGLQIGAQNGVIQPFLRGIGNSGAAVGNESSVAVYVDGVYYTTLPAGSFAMANVSRVEVLKGPQGTLFGRNASGGVIHLVTADPSHTTSVKGSVSYGNYNIFNGNLYATTGLGENAAIDFAVSGNKEPDGYGKNIFNGNRNGYTDYLNFKSKLLVEPSDLTRITLAGGYSYSKSSIQGSTFPGTTQGTFTTGQQSPKLDFFDRNDNVDGFTNYKQAMVSLKVEQDVGFAQLTNIAAYIHTKTFGQISAGWNPLPEFNVFEPGKSKQITEELQLASKAGSAVKWVAGLFYYHATQQYDGTQFRGIIFGAGFDQYGKQTADSYAAYGQASYEILPKLTLTGGLRYTYDKTKAVGGTVGPGSPPPATPIRDHANTKKLTFKAAADYQITSDVMTYASFSRGFKSLAYNLLPFGGTHNEPEVLDDYEVGIKADLLDRRLRINLAAFYYKLQNPQVQLLTTGAVILSNADSARVKGVDLDITAVVAQGLTLRANGTYLHSRYKVYGTDTNGDGICDLRCAPANDPAIPPAYGTQAARSFAAGGNTIPRSPKFSGDIGFDYVTPLGDGSLTLTGDYYYNSGYFFEPDNFLHQPKYGLFSGQIKYAPNEKVYVAVWGKNLNNKKYVTYAGAQNGPSGYPFIGGAPRTYGVTAGFQF